MAKMVEQVKARLGNLFEIRLTGTRQSVDEKWVGNAQGFDGTSKHYYLLAFK